MENESYLKYFLRIAELKRLGKLGYDEFGDLLLGEDNVYSSDNIRKAWYLIDKITARIESDIDGFKVEEDPELKSMIDKLEEKKIEIQKERYKLQATKLETDRFLRKESRFELFYDNIKEAIQRLPLPEFEKIIIQESENQFLLNFGDLHVGANFKSENNEYSIAECKRRFEYLASFVKLEIKKNNISHLKIVNVCDNIQGILRLSDLQINEIPVVESVIQVSRLIATFLNEVSSVCTIEYYHPSASNHSQNRNLGSKASELASEDMEKIIVNYISDMLAFNNRVEVISDLSKDYLTFDIFGFKFITLHGHQCKNVRNIIKDMSSLHRTLYDYCLVGHFHSSYEIVVAEGLHHNIEVLVCPSFIGSDPFSDSLRVGSKAMCKLYEFNKVFGHTGTKNIILN